jgi:hypothetical protein
MSEEESKKKKSENLSKFIENRYGYRLTFEELEEVKKSVQNIAETSELLRTVKLWNWDEPFSVFKPYRRRKI